MEEAQNYLAGEKPAKLMRKYSIPCIISLLVGALYSMPVSDLLTAVISGIIIVQTYRQLSKRIKTRITEVRAVICKPGRRFSGGISPAAETFI